MKKLAIHGGEPMLKQEISVKRFGKQERQAVQKAMEQGVISAFRGGPHVREFETAFAKFVGAKYALATTSGTTALHASLASLGLRPGDEVLVPAVTFVSTASVVLQENLKPVFVDIDEYFGIDIADLEKKITDRTRAIIPVHLYGQSADMKKLAGIAAKHELFIIEDACQAHGATYEGKRVGALGDFGCFSFFETKNMSCGEGGMITTSNKAFYEQVCLKREHGSPRSSKTWYDYESLGYNYNMTEIQAAIGLTQLGKLEQMNTARQVNAAHYNKELAFGELELPKVRPGNTHVWHNFPVLLPKYLRQHRDFFVAAMSAEGVPIDIAYPYPLYKTKLFSDLGYEQADCPRSEDITSRIFTLFTDAAINEEVIISTAIAAKKVLAYLEKNNE